MSGGSNSGYVGIDKRTAKVGSYGAQKHYLERLGGNFHAPAAAWEVTRQEDLAGWWKFDETTGTTASDSSAYHGGNDITSGGGTVTSSPAWNNWQSRAFDNGNGNDRERGCNGNDAHN